MSRERTSTKLGTIEMFCKAAELANFTAAAEALGVTAPAVSRAIGRLEERLGLRLFARTTRRVRLTEEGRDYFEECRRALSQIEEAERAVASRLGVPRGLLRLSVPTTYGHYRILPLLPKFQERYPEVRIEIDVSNRNIDFVEEGYDLAVRLGDPPDSGLVASKLEDASLGVFASPQYLRRHGKPANLDELHKFHCIQFVRPSTGRAMPWIFDVDGQKTDFNFKSALRVQGDVLACVACARAGSGLFQIYHFIAAPYVASGELVEVLREVGGRTRPFSILYPRNRHLSASVRAFVRFLTDELAAAPRGRK